MVGYSHDKQDLVKRLARIEGQVRGISRMVEDERYCVEILDQVSAIKKGLEKVSLSLLRSHFDHCVADALQNSKKDGREKIDEVLLVVERLIK
jgi:DNA-binding FrmR family transcriptional regulator